MCTESRNTPRPIAESLREMLCVASQLQVDLRKKCFGHVEIDLILNLDHVLHRFVTTEDMWTLSEDEWFEYLEDMRIKDRALNAI